MPVIDNSVLPTYSILPPSSLWKYGRWYYAFSFLYWYTENPQKAQVCQGVKAGCSWSDQLRAQSRTHGVITRVHVITECPLAAAVQLHDPLE